MWVHAPHVHMGQDLATFPPAMPPIKHLPFQIILNIVSNDEYIIFPLFYLGMQMFDL